VRFERILKRAGLLTQRYGAPMQIGVTKAISGYADVSELNLRRMQLKLEEAGSVMPFMPAQGFKVAA
jgi:N-acyl-L-homoserine lactone synthetase